MKQEVHDELKFQGQPEIEALAVTNKLEQKQKEKNEKE